MPEDINKDNLVKESYRQANQKFADFTHLQAANLLSEKLQLNVEKDNLIRANYSQHSSKHFFVLPLLNQGLDSGELHIHQDGTITFKAPTLASNSRVFASKHASIALTTIFYPQDNFVVDDFTDIGQWFIDKRISIGNVRIPLLFLLIFTTLVSLAGLLVAGISLIANNTGFDGLYFALGVFAALISVVIAYLYLASFSAERNLHNLIKSFHS